MAAMLLAKTNRRRARFQRQLQHVGRSVDVCLLVLAAPVGPEVVEGRQVDHKIDVAQPLFCGDKNAGQGLLVGNIHSVPDHALRCINQGSGRCPVIDGYDRVVTSQIDGDGRTEKARGAGYDNHSIRHSTVAL